MSLAVKVRELARPLEFVVAVHESCADPPEERQVPPFDAAKKVPLAPLDGAVKVTVAPETGLEEPSVTRATSGFVKFVLTVVVWLPPDEMAIVMGCACAGLDRAGTSAAPSAIIATTWRLNANLRENFTFSQPFKVLPTRLDQSSAMA